VRIYMLRPEPMGALKLWLEEMQEMWSQQMASFKAYVEKAGPGDDREEQVSE
jgi:hypothetical protein